MITHRQLTTAPHTGSLSYASFVDIPTHSFLKRVRTFRDQTARYMTHILPDPFPATTSPISRAWQSAFATKSSLAYLLDGVTARPVLTFPTLDLQKEPDCSTEWVKPNHRQGSQTLCLPRPPCHLTSWCTFPISLFQNSSVPWCPPPPPHTCLRSSVLVGRGEVPLQ